jgi:hypothetical protein
MFVRIAKWFVVLWAAAAIVGLSLDTLHWYDATGREVSATEWDDCQGRIVWWLQLWFFPTFGMIAVEFLFRDGTPMLPAFHLPRRRTKAQRAP